MSYVDEEELLIAWVEATLPPVRAGAATPADPHSDYQWVTNGFVKLQRIGGSGRFGVDQPRVYVECLALGRPAAKDLAMRLRDAFETSLIGYQTGGDVVLDVETVSGPAWAPYDDVRVSRFVATYTVVTHATSNA